MARGFKTGGTPEERAVFDPSQRRTEQEQLEILFNTVITEDDRELRRKHVTGVGGIQSQNKLFKILTRKSYIKGIVEKLILAKQMLASTGGTGGLSLVSRHIDFLAFLGLNSKEIFYTIYTFGYRNITFKRLTEYLTCQEPKRRINILKNKFKEEMELLQKDIFQDMAAEVMAKEKAYLEMLLSKLPDIEKELSDTDPIIEQPKWNRLNKIIRDILEQCKGMHGIELYRETMVKAQGAIAVQKASADPNQGNSALPMPQRHPEIEEAGGKIIELSQERHIIGKKEEL